MNILSIDSEKENSSIFFSRSVPPKNPTIHEITLLMRSRGAPITLLITPLLKLRMPVPISPALKSSTLDRKPSYIPITAVNGQAILPRIVANLPKNVPAFDRVVPSVPALAALAALATSSFLGIRRDNPPVAAAIVAVLATAPTLLITFPIELVAAFMRFQALLFFMVSVIVLIREAMLPLNSFTALEALKRAPPNLVFFTDSVIATLLALILFPHLLQAAVTAAIVGNIEGILLTYDDKLSLTSFQAAAILSQLLYILSRATKPAPIAILVPCSFNLSTTVCLALPKPSLILTLDRIATPFKPGVISALCSALSRSFLAKTSTLSAASLAASISISVNLSACALASSASLSAFDRLASCIISFVSCSCLKCRSAARVADSTPDLISSRMFLAISPKASGVLF